MSQHPSLATRSTLPNGEDTDSSQAHTALNVNPAPPSHSNTATLSAGAGTVSGTLFGTMPSQNGSTSPISLADVQPHTDIYNIDDHRMNNVGTGHVPISMMMPGSGFAPVPNPFDYTGFMNGDLEQASLLNLNLQLSDDNAQNNVNINSVQSICAVTNPVDDWSNIPYGYDSNNVPYHITTSDAAQPSRIRANSMHSGPHGQSLNIVPSFNSQMSRGSLGPAADLTMATSQRAIPLVYPATVDRSQTLPTASATLAPTLIILEERPPTRKQVRQAQRTATLQSLAEFGYTSVVSSTEPRVTLFSVKTSKLSPYFQQAARLMLQAGMQKRG